MFLVTEGSVLGIRTTVRISPVTLLSLRPARKQRHLSCSLSCPQMLSVWSGTTLDPAGNPGCQPGFCPQLPLS